MASSGEHFSLRWNNYSNHITNAFDSLRSQEDFVDVTLCCEGRKIRAHKVLLSACSLYFRDVFKENPCQHPVIVFKNVHYEDLLSLIEFMYQGEVSVQQDSLPSFLSTAELLSVQGLTGGSNSAPSQPESPIITLPSSSQTTYLTSHPHPSASSTKLHHVPIKRSSDSSTPNKSASSNVMAIKTFSMQTLVNKADVPANISIPATVKLRAIPVSSAASDSKSDHPIVIHQQHQPSTVSHHQQHQQQQQQQHQQIEKNKKRRLSLDLSGHVKINASQHQIIDENEYVLSDTVDDNQDQQHMHAQTGDEIDTQDEEEGDEEENETFLKMEIPYIEDDGGQQQQHDTGHDQHQTMDDDMLDDDEEEHHLDHVNLTGTVATDHSQADGDEQYSMMDSNELDIMYQQQQGTDMGRMYVTQASVDESAQQESEKLASVQTQQSQETLMIPMLSATDLHLVCQLCARKFTSHAALKRHTESKHSNNLVSFSCDICNKTFKTKWSLSTHTSRFHRKINLANNLPATIESVDDHEQHLDSANESATTTLVSALKRDSTFQADNTKYNVRSIKF